MIEIGSMTLIEAIPYTCVKIEGSVAFLQRVGEDKRGRFKKMDAKLVPYVDENNQLVIPKPPPMNRKKMTRFHYMKAISEDAQVHISVAFLIKAMLAVGVVTGSWYQAQMKFQEISIRLNDLEDRVTVIATTVQGMEQEHISELEEEVREQRSILQRMGLKKP